MRSFDKAYKTSRQRTLNEQQKAFAVDRAKLIAAVKKEYGIQDFNALSEKEKAEYKSVINEMWSKDGGLNENGLRFIMEGSMPLTEKSSDEKIESWFKGKIREDLDNVIMHLVSKGECKCVVDLKNQIEKSIGKKVKISLIRKWLGEVICKYIATKINGISFMPKSIHESIEWKHKNQPGFVPDEDIDTESIKKELISFGWVEDSKRNLVYRLNAGNIGKFHFYFLIDMSNKNEGIYFGLYAHNGYREFNVDSTNCGRFFNWVELKRFALNKTWLERTIQDVKNKMDRK